MQAIDRSIRRLVRIESGTLAADCPSSHPPHLSLSRSSSSSSVGDRAGWLSAMKQIRRASLGNAAARQQRLNNNKLQKRCVSAGL